MRKTLLLFIVLIVLLTPTLFAQGDKESSGPKSYTVNIASAFAPEGPIHDAENSAQF